MLLVLRNHKQQAASAESVRWGLELLASGELLAWVLLAWERWDEWAAEEPGR